jgi:hypothetical protein
MIANAKRARERRSRAEKERFKAFTWCKFTTFIPQVAGWAQEGGIDIGGRGVYCAT